MHLNLNICTRSVHEMGVCMRGRVGGICINMHIFRYMRVCERERTDSRQIKIIPLYMYTTQQNHENLWHTGSLPSWEGGEALCVEAKFLLQNRERNDGIKMGRISFGVLGKYKDTVPLCNKVLLLVYSYRSPLASRRQSVCMIRTDKRLV